MFIRTMLPFAVIWSFFLCVLAHQDDRDGKNLKPYKCLIAERYDKETKSFKPGTYFVLVSAEWCLPCRQLKLQLAEYPTIPVYVLDLDQDPKLSKSVMRDHRTVPCLVRYDIFDGRQTNRKNQRAVYKYGSDLNAFMFPKSPTMADTGNR